MFIEFNPVVNSGDNLFKRGHHKLSEIGTSESFFESLSKTTISEEKILQPIFVIGSGERKIEMRIVHVMRVTEIDSGQLLDGVFDFIANANVPFDKDFLKKEFILVRGRINFNKL